MLSIAMKNLDRKLRAIRDGQYAPDHFILADAKDADMAWGVAATGPQRTDEAPVARRWRTRPEFLEAMRAIVRQGVQDVLLASASNGEVLAGEGLFEAGPVTLAIRANDASDIWLPRGGAYGRAPSRPFRSVNLEAVRPFCDLGLYSVTFNNQLGPDHASLEAYAQFRAEAARLGFRHFLEVFNPNAPAGLAPADLPHFVNDSIARALAGVTAAERPLFLKVAYNGPAALEELVAYDPTLVVGVLGGAAGTTRDCYELLSQAERHGARVALFGRKINLAESPLDLVALMRPVLRRELSPQEAVRAYHAALAGKELRPARPLEDDLQITQPVLRT
jgi:DhnA family fructose-bisphosphate aldolase class Ia